MSFLDSTGVATLTADIKAITDATYPANASIAAEYDSTSSYSVGDCCMKAGLLYVCNTAIASGGEAWNSAHWTQVNVATLISQSTGLPSVTSADNGKVPIVKNGAWTVDLDGMTILSYGSSTWADFIAAYNASKVVYCRASSNSNPASGVQTRLAFMAYVNAATPTNVEFQYYRSVNSHSDAQQGDQVYVYKLDKTSGWSVTTRENYTKIVAGSGLKSSYSSGALTLSTNIKTASITIPYANWTGSDPYTQTITISGYTVTSNTKVDIQLDETAFAQIMDDGVAAMFIKNNSGTLTLYSIGAATTANITIQVTCYETV